MRNVFVVPSKLVCKGVALMVLPILTAFTYVYSLMVFLYRIVAAFCGTIGVCIVAVDCYQHGMSGERGVIILFLAIAFALRYLLPMLTPVMQCWQQDLLRYVYAPLITRPPVRYTI